MTRLRFERVFAACAAHDTELFTYSASTSVRAALLGAGFLVGRGVPTGTEPETTLAMTPSAACSSVRTGSNGGDEAMPACPATCRPTTGPRSPRGYRGSRSFGAPASRPGGALSRHRDVRRR